jgi:hypothetical protein
MDRRTGCRQLMISIIRPTRVALTPRCQSGLYVDRTGCHRLNVSFEASVQQFEFICFHATSGSRKFV